MSGTKDGIEIPKRDKAVLVLNGKLGALAIMRTLGPYGIRLHGVDEKATAPALLSRYCRGRTVMSFDEDNPEPYVEKVLELGRELGKGTVLIPTSDTLSTMVAQNRERLAEFFVFQDNDLQLIDRLVSKKEMFSLAREVGVPTALTRFPQSRQDVEELLGETAFPVMLKAIHGDRLAQRTGKKMVIIENAEDLLKAYDELEDPEEPNLMVQELIPGGDDEVYIFNGYFNRDSDCLAAFTGHKIRQTPIHTGAASLGECRWHPDVAELTQKFMKDIGYRGILDIGYRLDPRDGKYKVLDINPRVGQAFRLFVGRKGMDVVRALYLDLTGQEVPKDAPREGRRWMIEDYDIISTIRYFQEGSLGVGQWLASFRGLEEGAWFCWRDWRPFRSMLKWRLGQLVSR